jgi:hypothetical protein
LPPSFLLIGNTNVLLRKKERFCDRITGCTITPKGKFIFADVGTTGLHILNEDWTSDNIDIALPLYQQQHQMVF